MILKFESLDIRRGGAIHVVKTKALIGCAVTAQLICAFVFAQADFRFSHDAAQIRHILMSGRLTFM